MNYFSGVAGGQGVAEEEIGTVLSIVMAVSAGRVRAQFREVCGKNQKPERAGMKKQKQREKK